MSEPRSVGIESNPILFEKGVLLPARQGDVMADPQNVWLSMEQAQEWNAFRILGQVVEGRQFINPYFETGFNDNFEKKVAEADAQRDGTRNYTAARGALTLAAFMGVEPPTLLEEFAGKSTLDIGSGDGVLADELRRFAGAHVTELDISARAFSKTPPIHAGLGEQIVGNGTDMNFADGQFERVVTMFSTTVHTDTIRARMKAYTEAMRVTALNGRLFVAPLFGMTMLRQKRWEFLEQADKTPNHGPTKKEIADMRRSDQQVAALEFATVGLMRKLMVEGAIGLTPVLIFVDEGRGQKDMINAVIDIQKRLSPDETKDLIEEQVSIFTKKSK
jgi:SAM-dependent methyltransferase